MTAAEELTTALVAIVNKADTVTVAEKARVNVFMAVVDCIGRSSANSNAIMLLKVPISA